MAGHCAPASTRNTRKTGATALLITIEGQYKTADATKGPLSRSTQTPPHGFPADVSCKTFKVSSTSWDTTLPHSRAHMNETGDDRDHRWPVDKGVAFTALLTVGELRTTAAFTTKRTREK
ncbi:hypothetical protein MRX96_004779 [Rhipicephalus microplus]